MLYVYSAGLTPRLLLQMVCSRSPNALLSLRSGRLTFEFSVADGRPVHARWYDGEQVHGEGKPVLAPFLGVRAGRFSVEPLFSPPTAHFDGDAMAVLNPAALRTRRARELLSPRNWAQVDRIVLDGLASEHYAAEFPTQAALLSQLGAAAAVGADALRRLMAEDQAGSDPGRLHALLAELARHGAIAALLDRDGHDLLPGGASFRPPSSPPSSARAGRSSAGTAAVSAAAAPAALAPAASAPAAGSQPPSIALGEAVLDAVSAQPLPHAPGEPAFAPEVASLSSSGPSEEGAAHQAAVARAAFDGAEEPEQPFFSPGQAAGATDPLPPADPDASPTALEHTATESAASALERSASSAQRALSDAAFADGSNADADLGANSVTAVADDDSLADDDDSAWPPSPGSRLRTALGRGLLSLGAAAAAFLAIRALASRSWDPQSESSPDTAASFTPGAAPVASGAAGSGLEASGRAGAGLESAPEAQRADAGARMGSNPTPVPLAFDSELLELAPGTKLPLGQGALEIRSPQRQRIYVDGVLMGDAAERLIPLGPGTYQLRLNDGAHDVERSVEVKAGRRTRFSARPSSAP